MHGPIERQPAYTQLRCAGDSAVPDSGTSALYCPATRHADGLYVVEFIPLVRGEFTINVTVHAGPHGSRKLGNIPGSMAVRVDGRQVQELHLARPLRLHDRPLRVRRRL